MNFKIDSQYTDVDAEKLFFDYYLDYVGDISDDDVKDQFLKLKMSQRPVNGGRSATIEVFLIHESFVHSVCCSFNSLAGFWATNL